VGVVLGADPLLCTIIIVILFNRRRRNVEAAARETGVENDANTNGDFDVGGRLQSNEEEANNMEVGVRLQGNGEVAGETEVGGRLRYPDDNFAPGGRLGGDLS
jgi:hypothetical protein